jgi:type IV pilus assembly protein PilM
MRVLLAAAKKEPIVNLAKTMEGMGIGINCIDIDTFAMFNTYLNTLDSPLEESAAFLLMGHSTTDILISSGSQPCFMRQIQIAGKDITESISKNCSLSADEAGNLKQKTDTGNKDKVTQAISSVLEDLVREMQLSFGYFENRYNKSIKSIFCSGGMIYQEGVLDCLSSRLGAEFKKWDPFKGIKLAETVSKKEIDDVSGLLTVSLGLALRG